MSEKEYTAIYPAQCRCGHLFLEKYQFKQLTDKGYIGFCWCGFCRNKLMVKPRMLTTAETGNKCKVSEQERK